MLHTDAKPTNFYEQGVASYKKYQNSNLESDLMEANLAFIHASLAGEICAYYWLADIAYKKSKNTQLPESAQETHNKNFIKHLEKIDNAIGIDPGKLASLDDNNKLQLALYLHIYTERQGASTESSVYKVMQLIVDDFGEQAYMLGKALRDQKLMTIADFRLAAHFFAAGIYRCSVSYQPLMALFGEHHTDPLAVDILKQIAFVGLSAKSTDDVYEQQHHMRNLIDAMERFYTERYGEFAGRSIRLDCSRNSLLALLYQHQGKDSYRAAISAAETILADLRAKNFNPDAIHEIQVMLAQKHAEYQVTSMVIQATPLIPLISPLGSQDEPIKAEEFEAVQRAFADVRACEAHDNKQKLEAACIHLMDILPEEKRASHPNEFYYAAFIRGKIQYESGVQENDPKKIALAKDLLTIASEGKVSARYFLIKILQRTLTPANKFAKLKKAISKHLIIIMKSGPSLSLTVDDLFDLHKIFAIYSKNNPPFKNMSAQLLTEILENRNYRYVPALMEEAKKLTSMKKLEPLQAFYITRAYYMGALEGNMEAFECLISFHKDRQQSDLVSVLQEIRPACKNGQQLQPEIIILWERFLQLLSKKCAVVKGKLTELEDELIRATTNLAMYGHHPHIDNPKKLSIIAKSDQQAIDECRTPYDAGILYYKQYQKNRNEQILMNAIDNFVKASLTDNVCARFWLIKILGEKLLNPSMSEKERTTLASTVQKYLLIIGSELRSDSRDYTKQLSPLSYDHKIELFQLLYVQSANHEKEESKALYISAAVNIIHTISRVTGEAELIMADNLGPVVSQLPPGAHQLVHYFNAAICGNSRGWQPLIDHLKIHEHEASIQTIISQLSKFKSLFHDTIVTARSLISIIAELAKFYSQLYPSIPDFFQEIRRELSHSLINVLLCQDEKRDPYITDVFPIVAELLNNLRQEKNADLTMLNELQARYFEKKNQHQPQSGQEQVEYPTLSESLAKHDDEVESRKIKQLYAEALKHDKNDDQKKLEAACIDLINLIPAEKRITHPSEYGYAAFTLGKIQYEVGLRDDHPELLKLAQTLFEANSEYQISAKYYLIKLLQRDVASHPKFSIAMIELLDHLHAIAKAGPCLILSLDELFDLYHIFLHYSPHNPSFQIMTNEILTEIFNRNPGYKPALIEQARIIATAEIETIPALIDQEERENHESVTLYNLGVACYQRHHETGDKNDLEAALNHFRNIALAGNVCVMFWLAKISHEKQLTTSHPEERIDLLKAKQAHLESIAHKLNEVSDLNAKLLLADLTYDYKMELFSLLHKEMVISTNPSLTQVFLEAFAKVIRSINSNYGEAELIMGDYLKTESQSTENLYVFNHYFCAAILGNSRGYEPLIQLLDSYNSPTAHQLRDQVSQLGYIFDGNLMTVRSIISLINRFDNFFQPSSSMATDHDTTLRLPLTMSLIRALLEQYQNKGPYVTTIFPIVEELLASVEMEINLDLNQFNYFTARLAHNKFQYRSEASTEVKKVKSLHSPDDSEKSKVSKRIALKYSAALQYEKIREIKELELACIDLLNYITPENRSIYRIIYSYASLMLGAINYENGIKSNEQKCMAQAKELLDSSSESGMLSARYYLIKILQRKINSRPKNVAQLKIQLVKHLKMIADCCKDRINLPHLNGNQLFDLYTLFIQYPANTSKDFTHKILLEIITNKDSMHIPALMAAAQHFENLSDRNSSTELEMTQYYYFAALQGHSKAFEHLINFYKVLGQKDIIRLLVEIHAAYKVGDQYHPKTIALWDPLIKHFDDLYSIPRKTLLRFRSQLANTLVNQSNAKVYNIHALDTADAILNELLKAPDADQHDGLKVYCVSLKNAISCHKISYQPEKKEPVKQPENKPAPIKPKRKKPAARDDASSSPTLASPSIDPQEQLRKKAERAAKKEETRRKKEEAAKLLAKKEQARQKNKERQLKKQQARAEESARLAQAEKARLDEEKRAAQIRRNQRKEDKRAAKEERLRQEEEQRLVEIEQKRVKEEQRLAEEQARLEQEELAARLQREKEANPFISLIPLALDPIPLPLHVKTVLDSVPHSRWGGSRPREAIWLLLTGTSPERIWDEVENRLMGSDYDIFAPEPIPDNMAELGFIEIKEKPGLYENFAFNMQVFFSSQIDADFTVATFYLDKDGKASTSHEHAVKHLKARELHTIKKPEQSFQDGKQIYRYWKLVAYGYLPMYELEFMREMFVHLDKLNAYETYGKLSKHFMTGSAEMNLLVLSQCGLLQRRFPGCEESFSFLREQMQLTDKHFRDKKCASKVRIFCYFIIARYQTDSKKKYFPLNETYLNQLFQEFDFPEKLQKSISVSSLNILIAQLKKGNSRNAGAYPQSPRFFKHSSHVPAQHSAPLPVSQQSPTQPRLLSLYQRPQSPTIKAEKPRTNMEGPGKN